MPNFIQAPELETRLLLPTTDQGHKLSWRGDELVIPSDVPPQLQEFAAFSIAHIPEDRQERLVGGFNILSHFMNPVSFEQGLPFHYDERLDYRPGGYDDGSIYFIHALTYSGVPSGTLFDPKGKLLGTTSTPLQNTSGIYVPLQKPNDSIAWFTSGDAHSSPNLSDAMTAEPNDWRGLMVLRLYARTEAEIKPPEVSPSP